VSRPSKQDTPAAKAAALRPDPGDEDDDGDEDDGRHERRGLRRSVLVALVLLLVGLGGYGAYGWSQTQYFVGADGQDVAIYRGLSQDIGPISTSRLLSSEGIALDDLPPYQRERVLAEIPTAGLTDARRVVRRLRAQAERCRAEREAATASPSPTPSASPSPGDGSASPTPSPSPSPSATTDRPAATSCGVAR
jgi:protein phosphatase